MSVDCDSSEASSETCGAVVNADTAVPCVEFAGNQASRELLVDYRDRDGNRIPIPGTNPQKYVQIRFGEYGYVGPCQDGNIVWQSDYHNKPCDPGYFQVGECGKSYALYSRPRCSDYCPLHTASLSSCGMDVYSSRRVCQRLESDFQTVKNGTTLSICCNLSRSEGRKFDCPYYIHNESPVCTELGRDTLVKNCLIGTPTSPPNVLGIDCHLLWHEGTDIESQRVLYIQNMLQACKDNITHPACIKLLMQDPDNTQLLRDYLTDFCSKKVGDPIWANVCACYYPDSFYQQLRESLARFYQIPEEYLNVGGRKCIYKPCTESPIQYDYDEKCDQLNISVCTQSIDVTAAGLENVEFKQDCGFNRKVICDPECVAPLTCVNGDCVDKQACTADSQCGTLYECKDGRCTKKPEGMKWYVKFLIALAAIAVAVGLFFGLRKVFKKAPKTSQLN